MDAYEIAKPQLADEAEISELAREAYAPYVERIGRRPGPMTEDYRAVIESGRALVARRDGRIAGLLVTLVGDDHLLIENIAVAASERGTGLGSHLLGVAEDQARATGVPEMRLYTNVHMTENLAFYPRRGFRETHRGTVNGFDRVYFAKSVD